MTRQSPGIDVLRGASVLLVVAHHVAIRLPLTKSALGDVAPKRLLLAVNWNGYEAVFLFFVVSGFLITTHALDRDGSPATVSLRAFWARRFARIAPLLAAVVAVLSALHLAGVRDYVITRADQSLGAAIASVVALCLNWYEGHTGYLPGGWDVLWSLSVEEAFYLAFPVVLRVVRDERALAAMALVLWTTLPIGRMVTDDIWREKHYLPGFSAIALGVAVALIVRRLGPSRVRDAVLRWVGAAVVVSVLGWGDLVWKQLGEGTMVWLTAGAGAFVAGAWGGGLSHGIWAPLRAVGRRSYEVYLTHMFVVFAVVRGFEAVGLGTREGHIATLVALVGSVALGELVGRGFADPTNRWLRARLVP